MDTESITVQDLVDLADKNRYTELNDLMAQMSRDQIEDLLRKAVTVIGLIS